MTVEVQYYCPKCGLTFVVYHQSEVRNKQCYNCKGIVMLTGRTCLLDGDDLVTYQDGVEVARRKSPDYLRRQS